MTSVTATILVVDSNATNRETLTRQLEQLGYRVVTAEDGQTALAYVEMQQFQLVLLSIGLWGVNSYQVLEFMRDKKALQSTPIIMLTPGDNASGIERCLERGAVDYLAEPFIPAIVKARLAAWLTRTPADPDKHEHDRQTELLKLERDVLIARQIQAGFLPHQLPQLPGWEIAARFHPAREVAGDFYDAFMLTQNRRLGFIIADVCDKGVGAALFMSLSRSLIRSFTQQHHALGWMSTLADDALLGDTQHSRSTGRQSLPAIGATALKNAMVNTNNYIVNNHADMNMFVTLFFGVLDPITGALLYVNGGHIPPIIIGPTGVRATLEVTGPAVGMMPEIDYTIGQAQLEPGDTLFCYTDGVTDARAPNGEFFGTKRTLQLLEDLRPTASALLTQVETTVAAHIASADQFDDITMLAVRWKPQSDTATGR
jgi:sigma-B regulation protein RsbU (phosphoserine phosphatase)